MKTRKQFIAAAVTTGALLAAPASAQTPAPAPTPKKPSDAARALAARMRDFDPNLTEAELATIADGIDGELQIGRAVNPKGTAIPNSVEPATEFRMIES
ncbi:MAG TPA: hypothetical protein VGR69_01675 [Candidatus Rubrimentiphilum sp.]|nr:hypothetical protein [Candidatus Rubrimentiphilum sp.]